MEEYSSPIIEKQSQKLIFENDDDVQKYADKNDKIMFLWDEKVIDVTQFAYTHPGGISILEDYNGYDVSEVFFNRKIHNHSKQAQEMIAKYEVGIVNPDQYQIQILNLQKPMELDMRDQTPENIFIKLKNLMTQCLGPLKNIFVQETHKQF